MATRISKLSLEELYQQPKCTPAVWKSIVLKQDFSQISEQYCNFACSLPTKSPQSATIATTSEPVDILYIHSHKPSNERYKTGTQLEEIYKNILAASYPPGVRAADFNIQHTFAYRCQQADQKAATLPKVKTCATYLHHEISVYKPKIIIALGGLAAKSLNLPQNTGGRGRIQTYQGIPVVTTLEPRILCMIRQNSSGDMWGPDYKVLLEMDIAKAIHILRYGMPKSFEEGFAEATSPEKLRVVSSVDRAIEAVKYLSSFPWISFDIETTSLNPWAKGSKILSMQFSDLHSKFAIVFPMWHREWTAYDPDVVWEIVKPLLLNPNVVKVGHNVAFDALYTQVVKGVRPTPIDDTMQALHSLNSGIQGSYGLKTAVSDYLFETGLAGYEDQLPKLQEGQTYEDYPLPDLIKYAGIDALVTSMLKRKLDPILDQEIVQKDYSAIKTAAFGETYSTTKKYPPVRVELQEVKSKALDFLLDLEYVGVGYSIERNREMHHRISAEVEALTSDIGETFNLDSSDQLSEYLFVRKGYTTENRTQSGAYSTDGDTLRELSVTYNDPIPALIAKRSELKTLDDTFLKNYIGLVASDGRIHPTYNLHGTSSFRITGENPNLTQLAGDKHGYSIRSCYTAAPGMFFGAADYSSEEVKVLAAISRDPELLRACRESRDFHSSTAAKILGCTYEEFLNVLEDETSPKAKEYKNRRRAAKSITFAILRQVEAV